MSRVAEALRKSRSEITSTGALSAASERDPWTTPDDPWGVADAVLPPEHASDIPTPTVSDVLPAPALPATSVSREELTRLVQRIFHPTTGTKGVRSVLFSPASEQTDSSPLCAWAAHALAEQTSDSVCIVGGNPRMPTLHSTYGLTATRALSDALIDPDPTADVGSLVTRIDRNLWLLPAGSRCAAALPHVTAAQLRVRLPQLLAIFEYILVDASAASTHADVSVLGALVDGVVLVVEANATRRDVARRVAGQLQSTNVRVLGAVLTNRTFPIPETLYRRL